MTEQTPLLRVVTGEEGLRQARELTPGWPLAADRFVTARPLHDRMARTTCTRSTGAAAGDTSDIEGSERGWWGERHSWQPGRCRTDGGSRAW